MSVVIGIAFVLAILHFVYEGIILPSVRLHLRFRTFELRDRLRALSHDEGEQLDPKIYHFVHDALNGTLRFLYQIDIRIAWDFRRMLRDDPTLGKRIEKRYRQLEVCSVQEVHAIQKEHSRILACALIANSAGFFLMMSPFIALLFVVMFVLRKLHVALDQMRRYAVGLVCMPEQEFERKLNSYGRLSAN
jgi:hypothetical protein